MTVTILGVENVSYTSKKTNLPVKGLKIYYAYPISGDRGMGMKSDNSFISQNVEFSAQVGDKVDLLYNRFGSIEEVRLIESK